jgi:hypothetical protein
VVYVLKVISLQDIINIWLRYRQTSEMACDVVSLGTGRPTVLPVARQAEVVRGLAANVFDA